MGALEKVLHRNLFYQERYRTLCVMLVAALGVLGLLLGFVVLQRLDQVKPQYIPTTSEGYPIRAISLDQPLYQDPQAVIHWASQAVLEIYAMDYVNWRRSLQRAADYFLPLGYQAFLQALKASTNLEAVKAKKQVVSATLTGVPTIVRQGQLTPNTPYSWDLQMPILVVYENSENEQIHQVGTVYAKVERASLRRYEAGLALAQLIMEASS